MSVTAEIAGLQQVDWGEVLARIRLADQATDAIRIATYATILHADKTYLLPTLSLAHALAAASPRRVWTGTESAGNDCDDATDVAQGFLAINGYGNLAIGDAWFTAIDDGNEIGSHAALLGVTPYEVGWWEPQTGALYPFDYHWIFPAADYYRVDVLIF